MRTFEQIDEVGNSCADARWDRGQRLTEDERRALTHDSRWGSDGNPIIKLGRKWAYEWGGRTSPLYTTKREAVEAWEIQLAIYRRLAGLAAQERAIAESEAR